MSKKRLALRIVLVLMLVPILWIGYRGYVTGSPDHLRKQAEASLAAGDHQTAKLYLQKMLQAAPQSGTAHALLATVCLAESKAAGKPATFADQPEALAHLEEAARLEPENAALQERLLAAYLEAGQVAKAAQVAEAAKLKTADALYALLGRAVEQRDMRKAEESFYAFADLPSDKAFQGMTLIAKAYRDANRQEDLQKILARTARLASMLDEKQLAQLTPQDRAVMLQELPAAVEQASQLAFALTRMDSLIHACERLAAGKLETPVKLGEAVCGAMIRLDAKFPQPGGAAEQAARKKLQERIRQFSATAVAAGQAPPVMVYQSAVAAFEQGDVETGLQTIRQGLAAVAKDDVTAAAQVQTLQLLAARQLVMRGRFAEAKPYLEPLLNSPESAGWGSLLSGAIALAENRIETSLDHFRRAQRSLGNTPLVLMALAKANLRLQRWQDALEQLSALHFDFSQLDEEQRLWAERYLGSGAKVRYDEFCARLGLNQWEQAQTLLKDLRDTEYEPRARLTYLASLWRSGRSAQAETLLADLRRQDPHDLALLRFEVSLREQQHQDARAERVLREYLAQNPGHVGCLLLLGEHLLRQEKYDEIRQQLESVPRDTLASADEQLAVSLMEAQAQLGLGHAEQALELLLSTHLSVAGSRPAPVVRAGWDQATDGQGPGASGGDSQAVQPTVFEKLQSGGVTAAADPVVGDPVSADYATSVEAISGAVQRENLDRQLEATVRRCLTQISQPQQTQQVAAQLAEWEKQHPDDPLLLEVKADLEIRQGRFDSAISLLDRLELLHPGDPNAACAKAKAWLGKQQPDKARAELDLALARDAGHASSLLLYAQINLLDKRYAESLDQADRILRDNAGAVAAYLAKADALTGLGRPQEAVRALEDLIRINPKVAGAYLALGKAYEQAERADEAARVYASGRRSLAGQETLALAVAELRILARSGRAEAAQTLAGEIDGTAKDAGACLAIGRAFLETGSLGPARQWAERALERANDAQKAAAHFLLGETALWEAIKSSAPQPYEQARDQFTAVLRLEPNNFAAANNLAWVLAVRFNQAGEAARLIDGARASLPAAQLPVEFIDTLTFVYRKAGRPADAREVIEQAVQTHPETSLLHFHLGVVLADLKQAEAAQRALREALRLGLTAAQEKQAQQLLAQMTGAPAS